MHSAKRRQIIVPRVQNYSVKSDGICRVRENPEEYPGWDIGEFAIIE
jgi:hypothetical protein